MQITGVPTALTVLPDAVRVVADAPHAFPCRRCLTDAEVGETLVLLSYDPWRVSSAYRQSGPVFVHERECETACPTRLPEQQTRRLLSLRGYDEQGAPVHCEVIAGTDAEPRLEEMLSDPRTSFVHVHNAAPGCFAVRVDRQS